MQAAALKELLEGYGIPEDVEAWLQASLIADVAPAFSAELLDDSTVRRLPRLGLMFEIQGLASDPGSHERSKYFSLSFACWRALLLYSRGFGNTPTHLLDDLLVEEPGGHLALPFHVAATGLLCGDLSAVRVELERFELQECVSREWRELVVAKVFDGLIRLVRKQEGWTDILAALTDIQELREMQQFYETRYLDDAVREDRALPSAVELLGLYNLAQLLTTTGEYLRSGGSFSRTTTRLTRHRDQAAEAFTSIGKPAFEHLSSLLHAACFALAQNAIWNHLPQLGERTAAFASVLASESARRPVIELWPSQQQALGEGLLDPYRRAVLVEMPTSAGKTLLAQLAIVQAQALNPGATIAYVAPTRALVNQMTRDLRAHFGPLGLTVEMAVPAYELDPTERRLLQTPPSVLVTTPEKLDLLVRSDHPATANLSLVVIDEAHTIDDASRGPRLELLLGTIKRERAGCRFLLLSPFVPNGEQLLNWLGEGSASVPIVVDWKPARKLIGTLRTGDAGRLVLTTVPSRANCDFKSGQDVVIGAGADSDTVRGLSAATAKAMRSRGAVLILCYGPGTSVTRAKEISSQLSPKELSPFASSVVNFLMDELGADSSLPECVSKGVAYHHSGLSQETRWLIEELVCDKSVDVVCGTTTLAQGVNFPISTVVVEDLRKGRGGKLTYSDFWNVAGRAGRTLQDTVGVIGFPSPRASDRAERFSSFLEGDVGDVASALAHAVAAVDETAVEFNMATVVRYPELAALMQYLAHALRTSREGELAEDIEDLLRGSLLYHQLEIRNDQELLRKFAAICRRYLSRIEDRRGILSLADKTGFATPSVLKLLGEHSGRMEFRQAENWDPARLFGEQIQPLAERIAAIGDLPEIRLGSEDGGRFSPERVALILRDWVNGVGLAQMAEQHGLGVNKPAEERNRDFTKYLFSTLISKASWGLGALETVCLAGDSEREDASGFVPAMVYFGVSSPESVWMRTVGVPRLAAEALGGRWRETVGREPSSYDEIRQWISGLDDAAWHSARAGAASAADMRLVTKVLAQSYAGDSSEAEL